MTKAQGRELLDGVAGLWCVNAGYGQGSKIDAVARHLRDPPYATGYCLGSEPAARRADMRRAIWTMSISRPAARTRATARCASPAVTGMRGMPQRDQFILAAHAYHGSSSMGAGLTVLPVLHAGFGLPLEGQRKISSNCAFRNPVGSDPQAIIDAPGRRHRARHDDHGPGPDLRL